jgi:hypothetical protein
MFSQRNDLFAVPPASQLEEAPHQAETKSRRFVDVQRRKLGLHLDKIHC